MRPVRESTSPLRSIAGSLQSFWQRAGRIERAACLVGALLLVSGLIHLGILVVGGGSWEGPVSLRKAMTFGLSFGLTLITIVWTASWLPLGDRSRAALLGTFTVACALETVLVSLQAWRGVPSHFNIETTFDGFVARTLAVGGVVLVAFRANPTVPISLRVALRIGFVALFISLVVGALMIGKGMRLVFAGEPQAAYATGGTLKPTHAAAMHAILVIPLMAWLLSFANWTERRRLAVVLLGAAGYLLVAAVIAVENYLGVAPADAPPAAVVLFVLGVLALLAAGSLTLTGVARAAR